MALAFRQAMWHSRPRLCPFALSRDGWGSIEDVKTRPSFRRRGICRAILCHMQRLAAERSAPGLYLYHVEEAPGRIYASAGFEMVAQVLHASVWLER